MTSNAPDPHDGDPLADAARPTVFIVDDDEAILEGFARLLASADFATRTFTSAKRFLEAPCPAGPACLLLNIRLPELNGFDVQEALATRGRNLPIIFMTGFGTIPMIAERLDIAAAKRR